MVCDVPQAAHVCRARGLREDSITGLLLLWGDSLTVGSMCWGRWGPSQEESLGVTGDHVSLESCSFSLILVVKISPSSSPFYSAISVLDLADHELRPLNQ